MENVLFDPTNKTVMGTFKGFLETTEHKAIGNEVLNVALKNRTTKLIIDTSKLQVIRKETQQWIEKDWFPRASGTGIRYMAFIIPSDALGKMSTQSVNQKAGSIEIQYTDSIESAKKWISSKN